MCPYLWSKGDLLVLVSQMTGDVRVSGGEKGVKVEVEMIVVPTDNHVKIVRY